MKKRKILLGLAMAAMAVFTLAGCGDDANTDNPSTVDTGDNNPGDNNPDDLIDDEEEEDNQVRGEVDASKLVLSNPGTVVTNGEVVVLSSAGKSESATITYNKVSGADSYNIYLDGTKVDSKIAYTEETSSGVRTDLVGLKKGKHNVEIAAVKNGAESNSVKTKVSLKVEEYDRSGYAHFNNTEGVGAYKDDGTLKDNAIVLYVTDANKNSVTLTYKGKTVSGIGNILNSVGQECGEAGHEGQCKKRSGEKDYYGTANTNQGILLDLANDNVPLVVRFVGCVSNTGLYAPGTFDAKQSPKIEGLTAYDSVNYGGSEGDNGHMARMKSAKNITLEGVGSEATIDGWGFHLICETAYKDLAKNFEVRNLAFINTPEDAIGMEGQETESTLTITASVERCWVHHNTFIAPKISNPAESDKGEGDGSCDFKRGRYFTCSYNYFEDCHKTNLVGSSKTSVQYCLSYHHNIWNNCAARQPLARQANIHFYNNLIIGTTDTVASLRANSYMYSERNYYMGCSRVVEAKSEGAAGTCKSYNNTVIGCYNSYDATVATSREQQVESSGCKDNAENKSYANFDTNPNLFYYDTTIKRSNCYLTTSSDARIDCIKTAGSSYRTEAGKCKLGIDGVDVTTTASSATVSGKTSLSFSKGKGVLKVFTVSAPVTITIAATSGVGFDTGYLLKLDGTLVLSLSSNDQTAVLENGVYVVVSSVAFTGAGGKNDKETTVTKCEFEEYDSAELDAKLIASYNSAVEAIPATITYTDSCYQAIKSAMDIYATLGELKSQVTNYTTVTSAFATYQNLGKAAVETAISAIGTVTKDSGAAITAARSAYNTLIARCSDVTISNYTTLIAAENAFVSFAVDACKEAIDAIGDTITLDSKDDIEYAEGLYAQLEDDQKAQVTNYEELRNARTTYNDLVAADTVDKLIAAADLTSAQSMNEVITAYNALTNTQKGLVANTNKYSQIKVSYVIVSIDALPSTVTISDGVTINAIKDLYDSLTQSEKAEVTNYSKLDSAITAYEELASQAVDCTFAGSPSNSAFTVSGKYTDYEVTIGGTKFTKGLKMESSTSVTFTTSSVKTMTLYVGGTKSTMKIKVDGTSYTVPSNGIITISDLKVGSHTITKDTTDTYLYYVQLI